MPRKAGEKKKEMRETTNRTPAWVYVVSVVSALALGLGTIAIADYLRPSKRAARQAAEQAEQERVSRAKAETQRKIAEVERKIAETQRKIVEEAGRKLAEAEAELPPQWPQWLDELHLILDDAKTEHELYELVETYHTEWISIMGYRLDILLIEKKNFFWMKNTTADR